MTKTVGPRPSIVKPEFEVPDDAPVVEAKRYDNGALLVIDNGSRSHHHCPPMPNLKGTSVLPFLPLVELNEARKEIPDGSFYECTCGRVWQAWTDDGSGINLYERRWNEIGHWQWIKMLRFKRMKASLPTL